MTNAGNEYRFKIIAINNAGSTESSPVSIVLASVPDTPSTGPTSDTDKTNDKQITVDFGPQATSENGGADIFSYQLQIDNGRGGVFSCLIGCDTNYSLETTFTIAEGINSGTMYRFRYRSLNTNGYSGWSPITYIVAATVPKRPPAPTFVTATATSISLSFSASTDSKGSDITSYSLFMNTGGSASTFNELTNYNGQDSTYTVTVGTDGIAAGTTYRFKY